MGFRFRKSISIIPGVRMNLSTSGASLSVGPRGASVSFGKCGTFANLGLPGTGLSYRTRLDRASAASRKRNASKQEDPHLRQELEQELEALNQAVDDIVNIYLLTPDPRMGHSYSELESHYRQLMLQPYNVPAPVRPEKPAPLVAPEQPEDNQGRSLIGRIYESASARQERQTQNIEQWQRKVEECKQENELHLKRYQAMRQVWAEQYANWQYDAAEHEKKIASKAINIASQFASDNNYFESLLSEVIQAADWPRETLVSFQVNTSTSEILMEVDLPEHEMLPNLSVRVNARGTEIIEKELSQKAMRERYALHVHGIVLRLAGMAFCALPFNTVIVSGFTQRISKQTGHLNDEYIISSRIERHLFERLNFSNLENVSPIEAFDQFQTQRRMSTTFIFQPVTPIA
ncbi:DUF4236 domain-containing protein [Pantoea sp. BIGb0393]|uniref:DUF4236 domain-containing protein n=1 Tax=Pantoea nemavictus TaxID=2726955 RepID=A0ABU8PYW8_9GAMM|nr:DUF4236 domain-containing protein [Pantoea nemavictus]MBA0038808.1 DUF4236 domain-containing protein [Pantoea nemavictus]